MCASAYLGNIGADDALKNVIVQMLYKADNRLDRVIDLVRGISHNIHRDAAPFRDTASRETNAPKGSVLGDDLDG